MRVDDTEVLELIDELLGDSGTGDNVNLVTVGD